jgi:hypothetical protein
MQDINAIQQDEGMNINWFDVISGMYLAGVLLFFIRFILDLVSIRRILKRNTAVKDQKFRLIDSGKVASPFSFFNYIIYNSALLHPEELSSIISHEKVHSSQKHSLDMIISQLFCVGLWFNPLVWMYKKSISQNLEFIADAGAIKQLADKKAYQKTLLKITVQPDCIGITNHFYQSLIKKRIVMLNKQQSKRWNSLKYAAILPVLVAFMFLFQVKVIAQEKEPAPSISNEKTKLSIEITKDAKDSELEAEKNIFKEQFDAEVTFSNVTRNTASEITGIKVAVKDKTQSKVYEVSGEEPISPFTIEVEKSSGSAKNTIAFGTPSPMRGRFAYEDRRDNDSLSPGVHKMIKTYRLDKDDAPFPPPPGHPQGPGKKMAFDFGDKHPLIIINGQPQKKGAEITIPPGEEVDAVNVFKGKEARKKYGRKAKDGIVEITTRPIAGNHVYITSPTRFSTIGINDMNIEISPDIVINLDELRNNINASIDFKNMEIDMSENLKQAHLQLDMADEQFRNAGLQILLQKQQVKDILKNNPDDAQWENALQELNHAKKEIDEAVKELEDARKEFSKKSN